MKPAISSKYTRLLKDTGVFAIGSLGNKIILFFLVPLYTTFLTDSEYGTADLIVTISQLVIPFASLAIFEGVIRFGLSKNTQSGDALLNGMIVCCFGSIAMAALTPILCLYPAISEWRWLLFAYVALSMFNNLFMSYLKVRDRNRTYAVLGITQTIILAIANIVFLCLLKLGVSGYLISLVVSVGFNALLSCILSGSLNDLKEASFHIHLLKEMLLFSAPLILNSVSWWVIQSSDKIMIEAMVGAAALGLFTAASKIPALINVFVSVFTQAWGLSSIREYERNNDGHFYSNVFGIYQALTFGATILLISITKPFMALYVGIDFYPSWVYVPYLLASACFSALAAYFGSLYSAIKRSLNNMLTTLFSAVINLALNYTLILLLGTFGAVIATFVSFLALFILRVIDVRRFVPLEISIFPLVANSIIVVCQAASVTLNYGGWLFSLVGMAVFLLVNMKTLIALFGKLAAKPLAK